MTRSADWAIPPMPIKRIQAGRPGDLVMILESALSELKRVGQDPDDAAGVAVIAQVLRDGMDLWLGLPQFARRMKVARRR